MNVSQQELDKLADAAFRVNAYLLCIKDYLCRYSAPMGVVKELESAQCLNLSVLRDLVEAGAADPCKERIAQVLEECQAVGFTLKELEPASLALLSSPMSCRYAEAIRAAAIACAAMEAERGIADGLAEILEDYADTAELEVFGPVGLRGME